MKRCLPALAGLLFLAVSVPLLQAQEFREAHGHWKVDVSETIRLNPFAKPAMLVLLSKDVSENPFVLSISDKDFVTSSKVKVIRDTYVVVGLAKGVFTLKLTAKDRPEPGERLLKVQPRDGRLHLDYHEAVKDGLLVIFARAREDEIPSPPAAK